MEVSWDIYHMRSIPLSLMLDFVCEGGEVYVIDLSRLSRSTKDLLSIIDILNEKHVRLISLKEGFDTETPAGKGKRLLQGRALSCQRMCM